MHVHGRAYVSNHTYVCMWRRLWEKEWSAKYLCLLNKIRAFGRNENAANIRSLVNSKYDIFTKRVVSTLCLLTQSGTEEKFTRSPSRCRCLCAHTDAGVHIKWIQTENRTKPYKFTLPPHISVCKQPSVCVPVQNANAKMKMNKVSILYVE